MKSALWVPLLALVLAGCATEQPRGSSTSDTEEPGGQLGEAPGADPLATEEPVGSQSSALERASGFHPIRSSASLLEERVLPSGTFDGRRLWVWGGLGAEGPTHYLADGAGYDPATNTWTKMALAPSSLTGRIGHVAVWSGRRLYVHGGSNERWSRMTSGASFDPVNNRWFTIARSPYAVMYPKATWSTLTSEMIVVGRRRASTGENVPVALAYHATRGWRELPPPTLRSADSTRGVSLVASIGGVVYVFGGLRPTTNGAYAQVYGEKLDPRTNVWQAITTAPYSREPFQVIATDRGFIGVGGYDYTQSGDAFYPRDSMVYDAATDSWSLTTKNTDVDAPRFQTSLWYGNGKLYEWGGRKANVPRGEPDVFYRSGYAYDLATKQWSRFEGGPTARYNTISVWTGEEALIYGGEWIPPPEGDRTVHSDGAIYRP